MDDMYKQVYRLFKMYYRHCPAGTEKVMKMAKLHFFGVTSCSLVDNYQCFEELTGSIYRYSFLTLKMQG